ncbi:histidine-type phosphatase [Asaia astilbis]|uniref:histidine-type phosphatase n=1 Tax=Asaia astilbis TaxID=610244 RepID=UPI0018DDA723|nr:histidine-type phosphatase [Asaia astilbis]
MIGSPVNALAALWGFALSSLLLCGVATPARAVPLSAAPPSADAVLERVVLVARHGIRSPTHDPAALAHETGIAWPEWPVSPGQLTEHGRATLSVMMRDIGRHYDLGCSTHKESCLTQTRPVIWADSADDRTRESGEIMAASLAPDLHLVSRSLGAKVKDPLFGGPPQDFFVREAKRLYKDALTAQKDDMRSRPESVKAGLAAMQLLLAPQGCVKDDGPCLSGPITVTSKNGKPVLEGGPVLGASLAENLLLLHVQGLDHKKAGWTTAIDPAFLTRALAVHDYLSDLTRKRGKLVEEKSRALAGVIDAFLQGRDAQLPNGDSIGPQTRFLAFAGHDTTLDALAARYGLSWSFKDQPTEQLRTRRWLSRDGESQAARSFIALSFSTNPWLHCLKEGGSMKPMEGFRPWCRSRAERAGNSRLSCRREGMMRCTQLSSWRSR